MSTSADGLTQGLRGRERPRLHRHRGRRLPDASNGSSATTSCASTTAPARRARRCSMARPTRSRRTRRGLGAYPYKVFKVVQSAGAFGMESPGLIWIPTGVGRVEPALPDGARDGPPVVLRHRRQRPGARAVHRRGRGRLHGALRDRHEARQPLPDGPPRPRRSTSTRRAATTRRSTSRAATSSTRRASGWARPRSGPRCAGYVAAHRFGLSSARRRCSDALDDGTPKDLQHALRARASRGSTEADAPRGRPVGGERLAASGGSRPAAAGATRSPARHEPIRDQALPRRPTAGRTHRGSSAAGGRPTATGSSRTARSAPAAGRARPARAAAG